MPSLTEEQLDRFARDGYLVVENVLSDADLADVKAEYQGILDRVVPQFVAEGKLEPLSGHTFSERYCEAIEQLDDMYDLYRHLDISLPLLNEPIGQPTGRAAFPGFVARSAVRPELVLTDPVEWARLWWTARDEIASGRREISFGGRWDQYHDHPVCA